MILIIPLLLACFEPEAPPVPYTPQECALAIEFARVCSSYTWNEVDENHPSTGLAEIVEARKALDVAPRRWICTSLNKDVSGGSPYFNPDITECPEKP